MKIIHSIAHFQRYRSRLQDKQIGFVPTMGALHAGHLSLVEKSIEDYQHTIVSIFVNPTQFDNNNDLQNYPDLLQKDLEKLKNAGVGCVFLPEYAEIYPDDYKFSLTEKELSQNYCGKHRVGHFDGVLTVVMKLFHIIQPTKAYFGEKDYQQLTLIKQMVEAFFLPIEIVAGTTIREKDGLAMSSRNLNLTPNQRKIAAQLYATISSALSLSQMHKQLSRYGFKVDYLEQLDNRLLVAAYLGSVRLIDNVAINKLEQVA